MTDTDDSSGIAVAVCADCERLYLQEPMRCESCGGAGFAELTVSSRGSVLASTVTPGRRFLAVELDSQLRVLAISDDPHDVSAGDQVKVDMQADGLYHAVRTPPS